MLKFIIYLLLLTWSACLVGFNFYEENFYPVIDTSSVPHSIIKYEKSETKKTTVTGYTLSKDETDDDPCIGAGNNNLCKFQQEGRKICASRLFPLGTIVYVEGLGQCEVLDRTSIKRAHYIDILFKTKKEAITFGKKELSYYVVK